MQSILLPGRSVRAFKVCPLLMLSVALTTGVLPAYCQVPNELQRPKIPESALLPFPAHAPALRFGVATHLSRLSVGWSPDMLPMIRALGASTFREGETWDEVEKKKGIFKLSPLSEEARDKASILSLDMLFVLAMDNKLYENPLDPQAFARYANWIIDQHKGKVKYFEIWNEPENFVFNKTYGGTWNGKENNGDDSPWVKKFAEFAAIVSREIKAKHPEVTLIGYSATAPATHRLSKYPEVWKYLDVLAIHPYPYRLPPENVAFGGAEINERDGVKTADDDHSFSSHIRLFREGLAKVGRPNMPIWITETGYTSAQVKGNPLFRGFTELAQAIYSVRMGILAAGNGVDKTYFYDFYNDGADKNEVEENFGMVRHDYSLKPNYFAIRNLCALMPGDTRPTTVEAKVERLSIWDRPDAVEWDGATINYVNTPQTYAFSRPDGSKVVFIWQAGRAMGDVQEELANVTIKAHGATIIEVGRVASGEKINPKIVRDADSLKLIELPFGGDPVYVSYK